MAVQAVSGPRWNELLIVRGSGRVRTGSAQFRRPTRTGSPARQPRWGPRAGSDRCRSAAWYRLPVRDRGGGSRPQSAGTTAQESHYW